MLDDGLGSFCGVALSPCLSRQPIGDLMSPIILQGRQADPTDKARPLVNRPMPKLILRLHMVEQLLPPLRIWTDRASGIPHDIGVSLHRQNGVDIAGL